MAALIRHAWRSTSALNFARTHQLLLTGGSTEAKCPRREFMSPNKRKAVAKKIKPVVSYGPTLEAARDSLASRGYLRPQKSYTPGNDVMNRLDEICKDEGLKTVNETRLDEPITRFKLLTACSEAFNHSVPNSLLHTVETIADLRKFYLTPVNTAMPLDVMRDLNLPENLHVQYEYHRFHPDTDTMFGGKSAFPKSSTLVTGLKYKKKYPGHKAKMSWP